MRWCPSHTVPKDSPQSVGSRLTLIIQSSAEGEQTDMVMASREIIELLRELGRGSVADRLVYLEGLHDDDPDEPPIDFESLRTLASFFLSEQQMPDPEIGLSPRGLAMAQWRILPDGILTVEFLSDDWIRFAGISRAEQRFSQRRRIQGELEKDKAISVVRDFADHLVGHS